jgi:hypothetical protein
MNGESTRRLQRVLSTTVLLVACAIPLAAQQLPAIPNAIRDQLNQPASSSAPAPPSAEPQTSSRPASRRIPKAAPLKASGKLRTAAAAPADTATVTRTVARRDPFDPLIGRSKDSGSGPENLPPGKAGLMIATLRVDGVIRGPGGMIAVVSNPDQHVYFVHQGDQLYDGQVGSITMEAVSFHQNGKDPFGTPIERDVTKQLYPTPGEQP